MANHGDTVRRFYSTIARGDIGRTTALTGDGIEWINGSRCQA